MTSPPTRKLQSMIDKNNTIVTLDDETRNHIEEGVRRQIGHEKWYRRADMRGVKPGMNLVQAIDTARLDTIFYHSPHARIRG